MTLMLGYAAFARYKHVGTLPWFWIAIWFGLVAVPGIVRWTAKPLSPEDEALIQEALDSYWRKKSVCPRCRSPLIPMAVNCRSCWKIVDWTPPVIIGLLVLGLLGLIFRILYFPEG
jgi:hypothetical protein